MKQIYWMACVSLLGLFAQTNLNAQVIEMSTEVVEETDGQQMRIMSFSSDEGFNMSTGPAIMMASPGLNGSFSFGGADQFGLLGNSDVQSELNLVDEQVERFQEVQETFRERMSEVTKQMRGTDGRLNLDPAMIEKIRELSQQIKDEKREEIEGLLLPEQLERLKQVALQMKMKQQGTLNALGGKEVAKALGLEEDQLDELREKSKKLAARVEKEVAAAKEKAREELLAELTSEQQEKLKVLMGDTFEQGKKDVDKKDRK